MSNGPRKTFAQKAPPAPPIPVTLTGYYQLKPKGWDDEHPDDPDGWESAEWSDDYTFLRSIPFSEMGNLIASFSMTDSGMKINQLNLTRFLVRAVTPADARRLSLLLDGNEKVLDTEQMTGLAMHLIEETTGRPLTA